MFDEESPSQKLKSKYQPFRAAILCDSAQKEKNKGFEEGDARGRSCGLARQPEYELPVSD